MTYTRFIDTICKLTPAQIYAQAKKHPPISDLSPARSHLYYCIAIQNNLLSPAQGTHPKILQSHSYAIKQLQSTIKDAHTKASQVAFVLNQFQQNHCLSNQQLLQILQGHPYYHFNPTMTHILNLLHLIPSLQPYQHHLHIHSFCTAVTQELLKYATALKLEPQILKAILQGILAEQGYRILKHRHATGRRRIDSFLYTLTGGLLPKIRKYFGCRSNTLSEARTQTHHKIEALLL